MADFVALYRGQTISGAEIVAVSAEPRLVRRFFEELLGESPSGGSEDEQTDPRPESSAPALEVVRGGEG